VSVTAQLWTCPTCGVTERVEGATELALDTRRRTAQEGHAARHEAEAARAVPLVAALAEVVDVLTSTRPQLVVAAVDADRVRAMVLRRDLPVDVVPGDAVEPGHAYVRQPRRGVRSR
jgi:hypothetical protein